MSKTFDQGKDEVAKLCQYFATNQQSFLASGVKEAHVRQSLIDPFFESLGWDVRNDSMTAPQYREVIPEDSLDVEGQQKAPDYTFRVGTLPKFYAEAKKCGVNISADPAPAYQLRRYGFSAKLALSILTDFDELGVYDCASRPRPGDKASHARIQYFGFTEYPDRWREIWDVFSREAVWSGSFDQYAASKRKRGTSEVDSEFLKDIEGWRDVLARNLALRNSDLSVDDLNAAVQRIIDRIVFLRMAEDRGLESYGQLLKLCEQPDIYDRFMSGLCRKADQKYNSGLFHFRKEPGVFDVPDTLTPRLAVDDNALKPILQSLYFEHGCPYHFGVLPVEILGTVYERFLGKVIRLTAGHQAKVEEKPEVRKAGGVYYTPAYIVNYIVQNTIGKQIEGKSPADLADGKTTPPFRVLDMACGSGSFLIGAYQALMDHCLKWYLDNPSRKHGKAVYQNAKGETRLTNVERKRILTTHIFGVDIDRQAVETTKLSLLLKALEGENDATLSRQMILFHERALPNLSDNIKCGNSLIASDFSMIPEDLLRIHAFDWSAQFPDAMKAGGFDTIIGNPPYGADSGEESMAYFRQKFEVANREVDTYALFMEQSVKLARPGGFVSMIVPTGWYSGVRFPALRRFIACKTDPTVFVNLPYDVFTDAYVDTTVFAVIKRKEPILWPRTVKNLVALKTFPKRQKIQSASEFDQGMHTTELLEWFADGSDIFLTYADSRSTSLMRRLVKDSVPFSTYADIQRGVTPFKLTERPTHKTSLRAFKGNVRRYFLDEGPEFYVRFDDTLAEPKPGRYFQGPRMLIRELISRKFQIQAVKVTKDFVTNKSMQSALPLRGEPHINFLLGCINSRLLSWFFLQKSNIAQRDDFPKIVLQETRSLPFPKIDLKNRGDKSIHDKLVALVEKMLTLTPKLHEATSESEKDALQNAITTTDAVIDRLVYELYSLTEEEIKIVEGE